jgi:transposase
LKHWNRKAVRRLIRSAGAKLFFLPKYLPDLDSIKPIFAKVEHLLSKAAAKPTHLRSNQAVHRCIHPEAMRQLSRKLRVRTDEHYVLGHDPIK